MADNAACRLKPTQNRIPRDGVTPLSTTLDSIGPLANRVACCAVADAVMAGEPPIVPPPIPAEGVATRSASIGRSGLPDDLKPPIIAGPNAVIDRRRLGARAGP